MLANIKGLVDRLELSQAKAMMPLFEAISNATDAIEDRKDGFFKHSIVIRLVAAHDLAHQGGDETLSLDGFEVTDDGIGSTMPIWTRSRRRTRFPRLRLAERVWDVSRS
jgi:hypothetical protein